MKARRRFSTFLSLLLGMGIAIPISGKERPVEKVPAATAPEDNCLTANPELLGDISPQVGNQIRNLDSGPTIYYYQSSFYSAAGASSSRDSREVLRKKIQHFWHAKGALVISDAPDFNISNGSLLKYGFKKNFEAFVDDVLKVWQLPLNALDPADGRTLLDYLGDERARYSGTPLGNKLDKYYRSARSAGAKHKTELKGDSSDNPADPFEIEIKPLLAVWDQACYFSEDLAAVKKNGKWGYVDRQHQIRIKPEYDGAFSFSSGRAAVAKNGKWGYIDFSGQVIVPLQYADARVFSAGSAEVTIDGHTWLTIGADGKPH